MEKINRLLNEYIFRKCNVNEILFIYFLARLQNFHGRVERLSYKDIIAAIGCNKDTFYSMLNNLSKDKTVIKNGIECVIRLKLIDVDWTNETYGYWNITLLHNEYRTYEDKLFNEDLNNVAKYPMLVEALASDILLDKNRGYIQIKEFLFSKVFIALKPKAKRIVLILHAFNSQKIGLEKLLKKAGIKNKSSFIGIISSIEMWYTIQSVGPNIIYTLHKQYQDKDVYKKNNKVNTIEVNRLKQKLVTYMRGCKKYTKDKIEQIAQDVIELYINYKTKILEKGVNALNFINRIIWCSVDETNKISAPYINILLTELFPNINNKVAVEGSYSPTDTYKGNDTYKKPLKQYKRHKSSFSNFKNREYDAIALEEFLLCRANPEYFEKKYGCIGITLEDLNKKCEKK